MVVTGTHRWPIFDGWCAARNVDPRTLSVERLVHLAYYHLTRALAHDDRVEFDERLNNLGRELTRATGVHAWQDDGAPSWWVDEDEAAASTLAATGAPRRV